MNKEEIKQILLQNNLIVKKKYGQNFLLDEVVLNNIILKAGIKADSCVVEIDLIFWLKSQDLVKYCAMK